MEIKTVQFAITGMTCDHCAKTIESVLNGEGILEKSVSYEKHQALISYNSEKLSEEDLIQKIDDLGHYHVSGSKTIGDESDSASHLIIIGGGSAAFAAAIQANELDVKVTMINSGLPIGGTCVNVGCVPSKNLIRAAEELHRAQHGKFSGISTKAELTNFKGIIEQKKELVQTLRREKYINVIKDMENFRIIDGRAKMTSARTVQVNGEEIKGDAVLVAAGAKAAVPPIPGLRESGYLTNETAFELQELPQKLVVLGGNYIGLEIAQLFSRLGSKVTILEQQPRILPAETEDISAEIGRHLENEGINIFTNVMTKRVYKEENDTVLELSVNGSRMSMHTPYLLVAAGRKANTDAMGLEEIGVELDEHGFLKVDSYLQSNIKGVYGAGDVTGGFMFVYTAAYEGKLAVLNAFSSEKKRADYSALPWVVFTDPQVAGVGMNEKEALDAGIDAESAVLELSHVPRAIAARDMRGFIKLIRDKATDRLIGARIIAPEGSELLMEAALAIKFGIKVDEIKEMFHPYLTLSEGIKLAAITFSKSLSELSCCAT